MESSVHNEEPEMFDSMTEFEEYLMENSHLEFGYLWTGGKWMVGNWTTGVIHEDYYRMNLGSEMTTL